MCPLTCRSCDPMTQTTTAYITATEATDDTGLGQIREVKVIYNNGRESEREEIVADIENIEIPQEDATVLSAVLNINIEHMEWDESFLDEDNIMFQILKGMNPKHIF